MNCCKVLFFILESPKCHCALHQCVFSPSALTEGGEAAVAHGHWRRWSEKSLRALFLIIFSVSCHADEMTAHACSFPGCMSSLCLCECNTHWERTRSMVKFAPIFSSAFALTTTQISNIVKLHSQTLTPHCLHVHVSLAVLVWISCGWSSLTHERQKVNPPAGWFWPL